MATADTLRPPDRWQDRLAYGIELLGDLALFTLRTLRWGVRRRPPPGS